MTRDMTCIICPRGCALKVEINSDNITVTGNGCPKGKQYAIDECTNPTRTVTSSVRVENREDTMVSVKTENPVPKDPIFRSESALNLLLYVFIYLYFPRFALRKNPFCKPCRGFRVF